MKLLFCVIAIYIAVVTAHPYGKKKNRWNKWTLIRENIHLESHQAYSPGMTHNPEWHAKHDIAMPNANRKHDQHDNSHNKNGHSHNKPEQATPPSIITTTPYTTTQRSNNIQNQASDLTK